MNAVAFDSLSYFDKFKVAGFTEEQARVQIEVMQKVVQSYEQTSRKDLATKDDLQDVRNELKQDIQDVRNELKQDIQDVRLEMKSMERQLAEKMESNKHEMLKWMVGMIIAQSALIVAILAFLK